jgi:hypothetical protein
MKTAVKRVVPQLTTAFHACFDWPSSGLRASQSQNFAGGQIVARLFSERLQLSRGMQMATAAQEYRNKAATCLRLSKDHGCRLEEIARRWLELAEQEARRDQGFWNPQNEAGWPVFSRALPHYS